MKYPFFSIICTVYNGQDYIQECVESIIQQSFFSWELIIIDDGSTDNTLNICKGYQSEKIKVFHKINSGQYDSRLFGLSKASGSYILFLDSDDLFTNNALEELYLYAKESNYDIISFNYDTFSNSNSLLRKGRIIESKVQIDNNKGIVSHYLFKYFLFSLCSSCFKASVIRSANKDEQSKPVGKFGEDAVFTYEIIKKAKTALLLTNVYYLYRMHPNSVSHTKNIELEYQRIVNLNHIYSDLDRFYKPHKMDLPKIYGKLSWPIFTYIYSSALICDYKTFKNECKNIKQLFIVKRYFKCRGVSGFIPKSIVITYKICLYRVLYYLVKKQEKRTKYYEKNNY